MQRLQKVLASSDVASRRKAESLILDKRVKVNGKIITQLGTKICNEDIVLVDNKPITKSNYAYFLLNKPNGYLSTAKDQKNRPTVLDLIEESKMQRLYPVGRLDFNTTGLLLITNDGNLTNQLTHPSFSISKEYHVKIDACLQQQNLAVFRKGVMIDKNYLSVPKEISILKNRRRPQPSTWLRIVITEGKNRQIRKMMQTLNYRVLKLKRYSYSFLNIDGLKLGSYRLLKIHEIKKLKTLITHI